MVKRVVRRRRRHRRSSFLVLTVAVFGGIVLLSGLGSATTVQDFEIDAISTTVRHALYSGETMTGSAAGDDWAQGAAQTGIFVPSTGAPHTAFADCYGSNVDLNAGIVSAAAICDGNSDSKFKSTEPDLNVVSPSGKSPDDQWPIKPGQVRAKNDFSHGYVHARLGDSTCDADTDPDNLFLYLGGHVGDNEGDHFWGFEFNETPPTGFASLKANDGSSFTLDFNRQIGDFLVSFTVPGNQTDPVSLEVFEVSGFEANGSAIFTLDPGSCPGGSLDGETELQTNGTNFVTAPPWNVPVCDPTPPESSQNQCRLANGTTPAQTLIANRDFAEGVVDLAAFGIDPCAASVIFTSRSAHVLGGADIQDVGGADFPLCGSISGLKFHDRNADHDQDVNGGDNDPNTAADNEEVLSGWTINLYKDDGDGTLEDGDDGTVDTTFTTFRTTTTAADGTYSFSSLPTGDYIVCEESQAAGGWLESRPWSGTPAGERANCAAASLMATVGYKVAMAGLDVANRDFGNYKQGKKEGTKFEDANGDGSATGDSAPSVSFSIKVFKDANADGVLQDADDGATDSAFTAHQTTSTTAGTGAYSFDLDPGNYIVCEEDKATWSQSYPSSLTANKADCSADSTLEDVGWKVSILSGTLDSGNDFGNFRQGKKEGTKFEDANGDGSTTGDSAPSVSFSIKAFKDANNDGILQDADDGATDGAFTAHQTTSTTAGTGTYSFDLNPGNYIVCEVAKATWFQSYPSSSTANKADCSADSTLEDVGWKVAITSGSVDSGNDFANFKQIVVSGVKFKDADAGGDKDIGEAGLGGWVIHLFGTSGAGAAVELTATTAASGGTYSFTVNPGSYTVCEETTGKTGWVQSFPVTGANCTAHTHSGSVTPGAKGYAVTAVSGVDVANRDFGNTPTSHLTVTFVPDAVLPTGGPATEATSITCVDKAGGVGSAAVPDTDATVGDDDYTSGAVLTNQTSLVCTIEFQDP